MRHQRLAIGVAVALTFLPAQVQAQSPAPAPKAITGTYADIAEAMYGDALTGAKTLEAAVAGLVETPSDDTLRVAREAWTTALVPYQQSEVLRFGNPAINDWQGRVGAWRINEGLIDYTGGDASGAKASVVGSKTISAGEAPIDVSTITKDVLVRLNGIGGDARNVTTGYHAVEFLLWGQDLNGTETGAGARPATDFSLENCTGGNCDRRQTYITVATEALTSDLEAIARAWGDGGEARKELEAKGDDAALAAILTGIVHLSREELAGQRMMSGLEAHDPQQELARFSDETHDAYYYSQIGMASIYNGTYKRSSGTVMRGPSLADYVRARAPEAAEKLEQALTATTKALGAIKKRVDDGVEDYDQMLAEGNSEGNDMIRAAADALVAQASAAEALARELDLTIEVKGSGSPNEARPTP